ncbi:MAG: hypothetical protein HW387_413 [Parachlamydiales bacterium]|nr:hypothetical protein [Parachlamydiales bacterium]
MVRAKEIKTLSIQEAMDNLATIVSIDMANPPQLGIVRHHFVTDAQQIGPHEVFWLSAEGNDTIFEILDMTFRTIHQHLVTLLESNEVNWDDPLVRKGIQSMMELVAESAHKMDQYIAFRQGKALTTQIEERIPFQDLRFFYEHRFSKQFKGESESWSADFGENENAILLEETKTGLMDFESVRRDLEYELFSIRNENGEPYFNDDLLRNIKLACFENGPEVSFEEDPLLRVRAVQERDLQASSQQILSDCQDLIEDFYKIFRQIADLPMAKLISQAVFALYLVVNPRNLIQNTENKSSYLYFHDFQLYLRQAMNTGEYQKFVAYPPASTERVPRLLMQIIHALCFSFFYRLGGVKQETIGLIHRCMRFGEEKNKKAAIKGSSIWSQMIIDDEKFRSLLGQFPNGPLFKILDQIREEEGSAFDPLMQNNLPQRVFEIGARGRWIQVLRMPCPVVQPQINKVTVAEEFLGFLRHMAQHNPPQKHLLINLQDRNSWQEFARSLRMESLQKNAEFNGQLVVATLPKSTDFYYQYNQFMNLGPAKEFIAEFKKQISHPEEWGFFFPQEFSSKEQQKFVDSLVSFIHEEFFNSTKNLSRQNREDFIEIFYQFLILKWIEIVHPDSISFTCKDGIDTGAAAMGLFFSFIQTLTFEISKEVEFLRYLLYSGAFFVRERAIDPERFNRALSAMEKIDRCLAENRSISERMADLYHAKFLKSLAIRHI